MSIAAAIAVAAKAHAQVDGTLIKVRRGETTIECVPCGKGSSRFETLAADGSEITVRSQDYLILAEIYDFGDGPVEPERGDLILEEQADGEHTYELLDLPNEPAWRWGDQWRQRLRLHTKEIAKPS